MNILYVLVNKIAFIDAKLSDLVYEWVVKLTNFNILWSRKGAYMRVSIKRLHPFALYETPPIPVATSLTVEAV